MDWKNNPDESFVEAERRIADCKEKRGRGLYLGDLGLSTLPEAISELTWLEELRMSGGWVTDLSALTPLTNVHRLLVGSLNVPFPGVDFMSRWAKLRAVDIITPSDIDLSPMAGCQSLERLKIWSTQKQVDLFNFGVLATAKGITHLSLYGVRSDHLSVLGEWRDLNFVQLIQSNITSLKGFEKLEKLEHLHISETPISDLEPISGLTSLKEVSFRETGVHDLTSLARLPLLKRLQMAKTPLANLSPLAELAIFQRDYNERTHKEKREAGEFWFSQPLEALDLAGTKVTDLSPLAELDGLRRLDVSSTPISSIEPLLHCKSLHSLDISGTNVTTLGPQGALRGLSFLTASGTAVDDLSALGPSSSLMALVVNDSSVRDLSPISDAYYCRSIDLRGSQVEDLMPILDTGKAGQPDRGEPDHSLDFRDTPAANANARLAELAALAEDDKRRCFFETKSYLQESARARHPSRLRRAISASFFGKGAGTRT